MTTTVNADQYIKDLDELGALNSSTMFPVQEESSTPETSTFHVKTTTIVTFLQSLFLSRTRLVENKTTNWTVNSTDSGKVFVLSDSGSATIQCTIPALLSIGFEFEIEDVYGKTITFVPAGSEQIKSSSVGANYEIVSSALNSIRVRKISSTQWNVVKVS
jgi:hypothetical protein